MCCGTSRGDGGRPSTEQPKQQYHGHFPDVRRLFRRWQQWHTAPLAGTLSRNRTAAAAAATNNVNAGTPQRPPGDHPLLLARLDPGSARVKGDRLSRRRSVFRTPTTVQGVSGRDQGWRRRTGEERYTEEPKGKLVHSLGFISCCR